MGYGALLTDAQGVPFYIDGTRPLTLINKIVINVPGDNSGTVYSQDLYNNDGAVRFVFLQSNSSSAFSAEWLQLENNVWRFYSSRTAKTVTVFIFGYANQPVPAWGVAIYDATGACILTNESKVLRDVRQVGDVTNDAASGYKIDTTVSGSWAVAPVFTGILNGVDNSTGQPRPIVAYFYSSAYFDGANTRITSHADRSTAGLTSATYSNARNTITYVNTARY